MFGRYPTPVQLLAGLGNSQTRIWVKRDDLTGDVYGGNKVRRLEHILEVARARGSRRILTFGAAGSHHVLATTIYGRRAGFEVAAILIPQPSSDHAMSSLRAALAQGLDAFPASNVAAIPIVLGRVLHRGDFVVAPGGSSVAGTLGYVDAALELKEQIRAGDLPSPDAVVVGLGSGGTAAGLLAGCTGSGISTKIVAVRIVSAAMMGKQRALWLALRAARRRGLKAQMAEFSRGLELERHYLGRGYGYPTPDGERAIEIARGAGILLDTTYTAKTFAAVLDLAQTGRHRNVLYWHTLSSAPLAPLLVGAPELPPELGRLFTSVG